MTSRIIRHVVSSIENSASGPAHSVPGLAKAQALAGEAVSVHSLASVASCDDRGYCDIRHAITAPSFITSRRLGVSLPMSSALRSQQSTIIHSHGLWMLPTYYAAKGAEKSGAPHVLAPRGMLSPVALKFSPWKKFFFDTFVQKVALKNVRMFHATSEEEYLDIRRAGFSQPVAIIPNGVKLPSTPVHGAKKIKTVLSLGRIHPKKNIPLLLNAWARVEQEFPDWNLLITGPDEADHLAELAAIKRSLKLKRVTLDGPVFGARKDQIMSSASLFVLPTLSENFAMTVAESLASGTPVISTKGAPWAGLDSHQCGWWIDHGLGAMVQALRAGMSLTECERERMGTMGREWMASDFAWSGIAQKMLAAYDWLLDRRSLPDEIRTD